MKVRNSTIYGEVVRAPGFKQGQKVTQDDLIDALDRVYSKRYPIVPNAVKKGKLPPNERKR